MIKKEMIAMLLAGGQGSRLGVLTAKVAKPAVAFGGKYRIIDFPLSNCINSGIDTVGVLTQYQPLRLNTHIGIGIPWDLDRNIGGVSILPPYEKSTSSEWYTGTNDVYLYLSTDKGNSSCVDQFEIGGELSLDHETSGNLIIHQSIKRVWNEDKDYLYPIPTKDRVLTNGALTQNPGWNDGLIF